MCKGGLGQSATGHAVKVFGQSESGRSGTLLALFCVLLLQSITKEGCLVANDDHPFLPFPPFTLFI